VQTFENDFACNRVIVVGMRGRLNTGCESLVVDMHGLILQKKREFLEIFNPQIFLPS